MPSKRPASPFVDGPDADIAALLDAMNAPDLVTLGSCAGHGGKKPAYIDLAVHGLAGLRRLVSIMNEVDAKLGDSALLDVALNWNEEVVTACNFGAYPTWIMLSMTVEGADRRVLARMAAAWRTAASKYAGPRPRTR